CRRIKMTKRKTSHFFGAAFTSGSALLLAVVVLVVAPAFAQRPVSSSAKTAIAPRVGTQSDLQGEGGYRSPGDRHKVSVSDRQLVAGLKSEGGRVIADYGSFVLLEVNGAMADSLTSSRNAQIIDEN